MSDIYRTISAPSEAILTEKRSKFLAFAYPVSTVDEVKGYLAGLNKKYFDARHICWAYMLGPQRAEFRANDNGEPSGTAGKPILGQINSLELTDVLVAVVRYFGGIKLGTSGLIVAYRQAARDALDAAAVVELHDTRNILFNYPYMAMNEVMKVAHGDGCEPIASSFDNTCSMTLRVYADLESRIRCRLADIDGLTFEE